MIDNTANKPEATAAASPLPMPTLRSLPAAITVKLAISPSTATVQVPGRVLETVNLIGRAIPGLTVTVLACSTWPFTFKVTLKSVFPVAKRAALLRRLNNLEGSA